MDFEEYVHARHSQLLGFATVLCGDPIAAQDVVQESLLRAFCRWDRLVGSVADPHAYVRKIVLNEYISVRRRFLRRPVSLLSLEAPGEDTVEEAVDRHAVLASVAELPRKQRGSRCAALLRRSR